MFARSALIIMTFMKTFFTFFLKEKLFSRTMGNFVSVDLSDSHDLEARLCTIKLSSLSPVSLLKGSSHVEDFFCMPPSVNCRKKCRRNYF